MEGLPNSFGIFIVSAVLTGEWSMTSPRLLLFENNSQLPDISVSSVLIAHLDYLLLILLSSLREHKIKRNPDNCFYSISRRGRANHMYMA